MGCAQVELPGGTVKTGVPISENAAVAGHQPVAPAVWCGCHAYHLLGQAELAGRPVPIGVAKGEDASVTADEPVALVVRRAAIPVTMPCNEVPAAVP